MCASNPKTCPCSDSTSCLRTGDLVGLPESIPTLSGCLLGRLIILLVLAYRATLGWILGGYCRYEPTCSQYMIDAIVKYGPMSGLWRGFRRLARCHPFGGAGYDPA